MTLTQLLDTARARLDDASWAPVLLDPRAPEGRAALEALLRSETISVRDALREQLDELVRARKPREDLDPAEVDLDVAEILAGSPPELFGTWVHYPWLGRVVHVLPPALHRELRLDRNRYKITREEQDRLLALRVGVAGLSVGRAVATTLAREGVGGSFRLADFDVMSLSNLNRVEGGLWDVGVDKTVLAARQLAELDPYLEIEILPAGITPQGLDAFVTGLDVVVDECDDLSVKVALRERARAVRLPVVMATSDRGMLDVERFDLEPERRLFHGLLDDVSSASLAGLTTKQKVPYVLRVLDARALESRMAASLVEVKETISTWPQLASSVVLGGAMVTNAVRRIALGELRASGRYLVDLDVIVGDEAAQEVHAERPVHPEPAEDAAAPRALPWPAPGAGPSPTEEELRFVVACATLAPSGGNAQPWRFEAGAGAIACFLEPRPSFLDFELRASALAAGAALENAHIAARALGFEPAVELAGTASDERVWTLRLHREAGAPEEGATRARVEVDLLQARCTNRRMARSGPIATEALAAMRAAAGGLTVTFVTGEADLARFAETIADIDRLQFLAEKTHREIFAEIRWTREEALAKRDGLDVASLELDATDLAVLDVLRSRPAMHVLRTLGLGRALGNPARTAFRRSGAAAVIACAGNARVDLLRAGRDLERLWLAATAHGVAVHPWGSPFLFQRLREQRGAFEAWEEATLERARVAFSAQVDLRGAVTPLLVLRLSNAPPPSARSLRRELDDVLRVV